MAIEEENIDQELIGLDMLEEANTILAEPVQHWKDEAWKEKQHGLVIAGHVVALHSRLTELLVKPIACKDGDRWSCRACLRTAKTRADILHLGDCVLAIASHDALAELEARVRGEEREQCAQYIDTMAAEMEELNSTLGTTMAAIYHEIADGIREAADV